MSAWSKGVYTDKGLRLLSKLTQGSSLHITRAVTGTGYVAPERAAQQTQVTGIKQTLSRGMASYPEVGMCKLPLMLTNDGVSPGYTAKQIGLYANDPDEGEILYFLTQSETGTAVPAFGDMPGYTATWTFYFRYGQADEVTITIDPSNTVSPEELEEVKDIAEEGVSDSAGGNGVIVPENTAALPFARLSIYGKSTQAGVPSPSAPVDIVNIGDDGDISVSVMGKNIAHSASSSAVTVYGVTRSPGSCESEVILNGTSTQLHSNGAFVASLHPGTYTLSVDGINVHDGNHDRVYVRGVAPYDTAVLANYIQPGKPQTFSVSSTIDVQIDIVMQENSTYANKAIKVQLERSAVATEYEQYKTAQTITLSTPNGLPGVPVASGGNYTDDNGQQWICDEIDIARGVYIQRITRVTYDGSSDEAINVQAIATAGNNRLYLKDDAVPTSLNTEVGGVLCDKASAIPAGESGTYGGHQGVSIDRAGNLHLMIDAIKSMTEAQVRTWLGTNPVTLFYANRNVVETPLSETELAACNALRANNPITTVINDAGAWMVADCIKAQHESAFWMIINNGGGGGGTSGGVTAEELEAAKQEAISTAATDATTKDNALKSELQAAIPTITSSTTDLTAGSSTLATGAIYLVYE